MYSSYRICPKCKIRRFFVMHNNERIVIQIKKNGQTEVISPAHISPEDLDLTEVSCLGCSWKGAPESLK